MTGVIAQGNRCSIRRPQSALCAENEKLLPTHFGGLPTHAGVLGHPEKIAARTVPEHFLSNWQDSSRTAGFRANLVNLWRAGIEHVVPESHNAIEAGPERMEN